MTSGTTREPQRGPDGQGMRCDFCQEVVPSVRRVALHGEYERLRTPHQPLYACPTCFEKKDRTRLGLDRQPARG